MVACLPAPNSPPLPYGALKKGMWPEPAQQYLFVSPLSAGCESRFRFTLRGEMHPAHADDAAASETIRRLALDHRELNELRKAAIDGTLRAPGGGPESLRVDDARRRLPP